MKLHYWIMSTVCAITLLLVSGCCESCKKDQSEEATGETSSAVKAIDIDDTTFAEATAAGVVLVDFWAPWCPPCRTQGPIIDKTAALLGDSAKVLKVDVDKAKESAAKFGIQSIPTLVVLKDGNVVEKFTGVTQADELVAAVKAAL